MNESQTTGDESARHREALRLERVAGWYLNEQLDFDRRVIAYRFLTMERHLCGGEGLELGPADGVMTRLLLPKFSRLTIVEGAQTVLDAIPDAPNLVKVHALFEAYEPTQRFDAVIIDHVLEHVDDPVQILSRVRNWLAVHGRLLVGVPNGHSINRLLGVKMGLLKHPCELSPRDHRVGHRRVYTKPTLIADIESSGLRVLWTGGVFFKPFSAAQMQEICTDEMMAGLYELGQDFQDFAAELYAVCTV